MTELRIRLAQLSTDVPGEHSVSMIRELTRDEADEIEQASDLVLMAGNAAGWQRCRRLFELVVSAMAALQESDPPGPGEIARVRSAFGSFASALTELVGDLEGAVQEFAAPDEMPAFAEYLDEAREHQSWRHVGEIADTGAGSFKAAPDGRIVWQRNTDQAVLDPEALAAAALQEGQRLLTHHYLAIGAAVTDAAKLLLTLQAETPGGAPAIIELTLEGDGAAQMTPRLLALDRIAPAMRAMRLAPLIAEQEEQGRPQQEADPVDPAEPALREPASGSGPNAEAPPSREPVELGALFSLARTLDEDLEKAWSAALDQALAAPAIKKQMAAVISLISVLQKNLEAQTRELDSVGIDARIDEWPLSDKRLAALDLSAGLEQRMERSGLAQLEAFVDVMKTLDGLREPANITLSFNQDGESVERFWSAGAFGLLRDRILLLERLTREHDADVAELAKDRRGEAGANDAPESPSLDSFERIRLGGQALAHGDPEAAMLHGLLAVTAFLGVALDQLPAALADRSNEAPSVLSSEEKKILCLATEGLALSLTGKPRLPLATLLAAGTLRAAHKLTIGPIAMSDLSSGELAELIESRQPLQPLEQEDDRDT